MASIPLTSETDSGDVARRSDVVDGVYRHVMLPLASLKLTVVLFALAVVVILVGTLAQVEKDIWQVLEDYFKPWVTRVEVPLLFPRSWFPQRDPVQVTRVFAWTMMGLSLLCAAMIVANSPLSRAAAIARTRQSRATWLAGAVVFCGGLISISSLLTGGFWFPGGAMIGAVMCVNLVAAHVLRFKLQARGRWLWAGLAVTSLGVILTWVVVQSGHNPGGFQGQPPFEWRTLWQWVKVSISIVAGGLLAYAFLAPAHRDRQRHLRWICGGLGISLAVLATWLWATRETTYLGDSGMRVLWQLILGLLAAVVLLLGCIPLFGRRAGIVVLHGGVALLMFGQWFVSSYDVEEQMTMREGQTVSFGQDIRSVELAVIDRQSSQFAGQDDVVVIPLTRNGKRTRFVGAQLISDDRLPFDVEVVRFLINSRVESLKDSQDNPANSGNGQRFRAVERRGASGASSSTVDLASGYFRFISKQDGHELGTFLIAQDELMMRDGTRIRFDTEQITVADRTFDVQLRYLRNYKDYSLQLIDFRKDDYLGTDIPRNYSSQVLLQDPRRGVEQELNIWMNNPRRYAGETFYQSGWQMDSLGNEYSTLQVVRNHGWMIPYVACMICMIGMLAHFTLVLLRFLSRRSQSPSDVDGQPAGNGARSGRSSSKYAGHARWWVPAIVLAAAILLLARVASPPRTAEDGLQVEQFGELPLVYQGRVKPFDTLARNSLRVVADAESFVGVLPPGELQQQWPEIEAKLKARWTELKDVDLSAYQNGDFSALTRLIEEKTQGDHYAISGVVEKLMCRRQPAIRWLLDVMCGSERARRHRVVRIYHPQVRDMLGLERRKGFRYSLEEMSPKMDEFQEQVRQANEVRSKDVEKLELYQRKLLAVSQKLRTIVLLHRAFTPSGLPPLPTSEEFEKEHTTAMDKVKAFQQAAIAQNRALQAEQPPLAVAPVNNGDPWEAYAAAWPRQLIATQVLGQEPNPSFRALNEILVAYLDQNAEAFNRAVASYHRQLERDPLPPAELQVGTSATASTVSSLFGTFYRFEAYFNHFAPFLWCSILYVLAFVLLAMGWLGWRQPLNRAAFCLIGLTFIVHTLALAARIYISGRPPVTNLYSSAVFIGWGTVGLGLVLEAFFRNGLASVIAAASGFATLVIAHKLAGDGDTFQVLQAVLDTQFWLATHVVCITFGYATTFLAGGLGLLFILRGVFTPSLSSRTAGELGRMIYGTLCFAILFSFIGTILGGLWADDSWGRFWGWDPKENGALIIVLWNALILHARWDGMIKERGMAVLATLGNVVTAWSWFGVNELGVGLHSYGFTEGRLVTLALVMLAHIVMVLVGWLPTSLWWSYSRRINSAPSPNESTLAADS